MRRLSFLLPALLALAPGAALAQTAAAPGPFVVVIAPGHGGDDPGAIFPPDADRPEIEEKNLTLPIALKVRERLQAEDVQVVMTRTSDLTTTAEERADIAARAHAKIFVAVHINSFFADRSVRGAEAQYFSDPALADDVADGLVLSLRQFDETVRTSKDREQDNILSMPGVIVEAGYLSNSADRQLLQTDSYQNAVADGIYQGILKYAPEIEQLKPRLEAAKVAHPQAAPIPAAAARQATSRGAGWLGPVLVSGGLGFALLATVRRAHARRRRRTRRIPSYGVVRVR